MSKLTVRTNEYAVPPVAGTRLARTRLVQQLEDAPQALVLVVAPAGYGKSTTVSEWARKTTADVCWFSCDEWDCGPEHFWRGLIGAVTSRWPGVCDEAAWILEHRSDAQSQLARSLANDLAGLPGASALVIDDLHFALSAQPALRWLCQAMEPSTRLLLVSRFDPTFSVAKLRLTEAVVELRANDLAFSKEEAHDLCSMLSFHGDADTFDRVFELVEGWPVGFQLAALAMSGSDDHVQIVDALAEAPGPMYDYLVTEVLNTLPDELVEFMTTIAVLEEFDVSLCKAVSANPNAKRLLGQTVSGDLFISQIDAHKQRYRFHHLFGTFLRARLRDADEDRFRQAHDRAIDALEVRGDRLGALRHAMTLGDARRAADVVNETLESQLHISDSRITLNAILFWLSEYGYEAARNEPEQLLEFAAVLALAGRREVEGWLREIAIAHPQPEAALSALLHLVWTEYEGARGDSDKALRHHEQAVVAISAADHQHPLFALAPVHGVAAHLMAGDVPGALSLVESTSFAHLHHPISDDVRLPALRAWIALYNGELKTATSLAQRALSRARELHAVAHSFGIIVASLVQAGVHLERREFSAAGKLFRLAEKNGEVIGPRLAQSWTSLWLARLATAENDEQGASIYLTEAKLAFSAPSQDVRAGYLLEELRQDVAFAPQRGMALVPGLPDRPEAIRLHARLAVALGDHSGAADLLDCMDPPSTVREHVEWGVLRALAEEGHDLDAAHNFLRPALLYGRREGFFQTILEQGTAVSSLLKSFPVGEALESYVEQLISMAESFPLPPRPTAETTFVEPLTSRELTVLKYLSSRLTNREIATALFVSKNTIKTHEKHIYRKLEVTGRRDAVEVGRTAGLI